METNNQIEAAEAAYSEKLTPDEAAQEIIDHLTTTGYSLGEKVALCSTLRRLLRAQGEAEQRVLTDLLDRL